MGGFVGIIIDESSSVMLDDPSESRFPCPDQDGCKVPVTGKLSLTTEVTPVFDDDTETRGCDATGCADS